MADTTSQGYPRPVQFAIDLANGRHVLSKYIPVLLWLFDGVLTSLVIWKVPCKLGRAERP